jgi:hypothetical protein
MIRKTLLSLLAAAGIAAAGPALKVDKTVHNAGSAPENTTVRAVFKLKNTGDEPLMITSVRPGCGCTVVKYDTLIAPGKTGVIEPAVDLKGMRPGPMSRGVYVTSNAENMPTLNLTIQADVLPSAPAWRQDQE